MLDFHSLRTLFSWLDFAWEALIKNIVHWMAWNLFLAFIPLALSFWLFRKSRSRSFLWWVGLLIFIAFLPNAPYVLTDIIHLISEIHFYNSVWLITLVLIPEYFLFIFAGFEAYVLSLINLGYYLKRQGWGKFVLWVELLMHGLSAIGIYLGRFQRFNSWDFVTQPDALAGTVIDDALSKRPLALIAITFVVIACLYWLIKQLSLALIVYRKTMKSLP
jgi:uncharacterized membrane protein